MTTYTLTIPAPCAVTKTGRRTALWLNANDRGHWSRHSRLTRIWRTHTNAAARQARIPRLEKAHITATIHKTRAGRWDPANLYPTVKACVDGLVDARVLPDDDAEHLTGPDMRAGQPQPEPCLILTITTPDR